MHRRAFRPEVPGYLEDRSLLSSVAGPPADPFVLSHKEFNFIGQHIRQGFVLFGRYHDFGQLHSEVVDDVIVNIPFEHADGLDVTVDRILDRMRREISAHVPHAVRTAQTDVLDAYRAQVAARVQAGDVVLR